MNVDRKLLVLAGAAVVLTAALWGFSRSGGNAEDRNESSVQDQRGSDMSGQNPDTADVEIPAPRRGSSIPGGSQESGSGPDGASTDSPDARPFAATRRHLEGKLEELESLDLSIELSKAAIGAPSAVYLPESVDSVVASRSLNPDQMSLDEAERLGLRAFVTDWNRRVHEASVPLQSATWNECLVRLDRGQFVSQPREQDLSEIINRASDEGAVLSVTPGQGPRGESLHRLFYISRLEAPDLVARRDALRETVMQRRRALRDWFAQFR